MQLDIPILTERDIELRVGRIDKNGQYCVLLAYKDARVDRRILDKIFGCFNWKREHQLIDGQLFCTVSVWDAEKGQWIGKQDVGIESQTQAEKGRASDSFKRACFQWGIGIELYDAPYIKIPLEPNEVSNGKLVGVSFRVKTLAYDKEKGEYTKFVVIDNHRKVRYELPSYSKEKAPETPRQQAPESPKKQEPAKKQEASLKDVAQISTELGGTIAEIGDKYVRIRNGICEAYIGKLKVWVTINSMSVEQQKYLRSKEAYKSAWPFIDEILQNAKINSNK